MVAEATVVFDVNETLLDLSGLDAVFEEIFGAAGVRGAWFSQVLQSALVSVATGVHHDFGTIGRGALDMVASRRGIELDDPARDRVLGDMRRLPRIRKCPMPWPACRRRACGWRR